MVMKKRIAWLMILLIACTLTACATKSGDKAVVDDGRNGTVEAEKMEDNVPIVRLTSFTAFETIHGEGKDAVEDAINRYLDQNGFRFHIQLEIMGRTEYITNCNMNLANGSDIDVFLSLDLSAHVSQNAVLPLDAFFENELKDAVSLFDQDWLDCSMYRGSHYAIPAHTTSATTMYYICRADLIQELGYDVSKVTDIASLEELFSAVKKRYPQMWCTDAQSVTTADILNVSGGQLWGFISSSCGVGMSAEREGTVENYYASETFREACRISRRWYEKGYLNPGGSTDTTYGLDYIADGQSFGWLVGNCNTAETQASGHSAICGLPLIAIPVAESADSDAGFSWAIASSTKYPSEAAQLLNLLYVDEYILNAVTYGIEGDDYVWNDDHTMIQFPDGKSSTDVPYSYYVGITVVGDRLKSYPFADYNTEADLAYIQNKINHPLRTPVYGMAFDTNTVKARISSVSNVVKQYELALLSGELDETKYLPMFLDDLKAAGIDEIVAEAQAQYNAWIAGSEVPR